jgi:hypothetical protein
MRNRTTIVFGTAVAGLVAWMLLSQGAAVGATAGTLTIGAPTMVQVAGSSHNSSSCGSKVGPLAGEEGQGVIQNGDGSYLGAVNLAQGSTVTSLRLTAHDNTDPGDVFAYLVRKSAKAQAGFTGKYDVMATIKSNGAVDSARRFTTTAISNAVIDNPSYGYWVELVNCDSTIQPTSVQVEYTSP